MRWLFLLLLMLNVFYYIWHQQEAPLRAKEVMPLALQRASGQDIKLLSESSAGKAHRDAPSDCLYLGGFAREGDAHAVEQRLNSLDIQSRFEASLPGDAPGYWLQIAPASRRLVSDALLTQLSQDFPQFKNKIMSCEGIASPD